MAKIKTKKQIDSSITTRPPVVCVLGHVDHGKTTLLDYIRKTHIVARENGGITQHIGAYQVKLKVKSTEELITFIDTPGHAAFSKIRCRGASVADLAVLVIDATEGVKAQTIESLQVIKEAAIPLIVAANKIDLPGASVDKVKAQLVEKGVLVEGYGGQVVVMPISAKTGEGVDELLEMVILQAEMQELKADLKALPEAVVVEAKLDSRRGPLATIIVKNGIIHLGDYIIAKEICSKIKAMFDENGKSVFAAEPAKPVEILGFKEVPEIGSLVKVTDERKATPRRESLQTQKHEISKGAKVSENGERVTSKLRIILKADVSGSLEAIKASLPKEVVLIDEGIGDVNESDIFTAVSTKALILAFRAGLPKQVQKLAEFEKVPIKSYKIIYQLLEDMEKKVLILLEPTIEETVLGEAKVIAAFKIRGNHIAGCKVNKGKFNLGDKVHIRRENKLVADSKIKNMQKNRQVIKVVKAGDEVGLVFNPDIDFKISDDIISYNVV